MLPALGIANTVVFAMSPAPDFQKPLGYHLSLNAGFEAELAYAGHARTLGFDGPWFGRNWARPPEQPLGLLHEETSALRVASRRS